MNDGILYGFVPHQLSDLNQPELNVFPFNVMFARYGVKDGKNVMGSAIYVPEFETFKTKGNMQSMNYKNMYGGDGRLIINYDRERKSYSGEKWVNGESVGRACGPGWKIFFVQFTMLGLSVGEQCEFTELKDS